jgi:glycosyltransferase involved in cell wall biosynthesis
MSHSRKRILFFTPYATRTGSEILIYYILKYFDRTKFEAGIVCFAQGELLNDLPKDIPVFHVPSKFNLTQKIAFHLGLNPITRALDKIHKTFQADIWYVNTIMLPDIVKLGSELKIPTITHIHELPKMYAHIRGSEFKTIVDKSDLIICCSDIAKKCIQESGGKRLERLYNFVEFDKITSNKERVAAIRKEWGVEPDDFVWIMSGTSSENKGFNLLPDIALQLPKNSKIHLVWVGQLSNDGLVYWTEQRCKKIDHIKIHLIGSKKEDYYSYMDAADGFMLLSQQESFGMVLLEAAWLGKPIVSFESGGPSEVITSEMGSLIPILNIPEFVKKMLEWSDRQKTYDVETVRKSLAQYSVERKVREWEEIVLSV